MTDQPKTWFSDPAAGQQPNASNTGNASKEPGQQNAGTPDINAVLARLNALEGDLPKKVTQAIQEFSRTQQSMRDKQTAAIQKAIDGAIKVFTAANGGQAPTQQQAEVIKSQVLQQNQAPSIESDTSQDGLQGQQPPAGDGKTDAAAGETSDWRVKLVNSVLDKAGVELSMDSPEAPALRAALESNDATKILEAASTAAQAARARISNQALVGSPLGGGAGGPGENNPIKGITDPGQLLKMGLDETRSRR